MVICKWLLVIPSVIRSPTNVHCTRPWPFFPDTANSSGVKQRTQEEELRETIPFDSAVPHSRQAGPLARTVSRETFYETFCL